MKAARKAPRLSSKKKKSQKNLLDLMKRARKSKTLKEMSSEVWIRCLKGIQMKMTSCP